MKKNILIIMAFVMAFMLGGCHKASHNGHLDGMWKVEAIEDNATGEILASDPYLFYSFYLDVVWLSGDYSLFGNFSYDADARRLTMEFPPLANDPNQNPVSIATWLPYYGIMKNPDSFDIIKLTSSRMIMQSESTTVRCVKY